MDVGRTSGALFGGALLNQVFTCYFLDSEKVRGSSKVGYFGGEEYSWALFTKWDGIISIS